MRLALLILVSGCINIESGKGADTGDLRSVNTGQLAPFTHDCSEASNDIPEHASIIDGDHEGIDLCEQDVDFYVVDIQPGTWLSLTMHIEGSGHNGTDHTDLDLWEINRSDSPIDPALDRFDTDLDGYDVIWSSEAHSPLERLAWFNPSESVEQKLIMVNGFDGAVGEYTLEPRESDWSPNQACGDTCNDLMLFPQAFDSTDGYVVTQWTQYSHARRAVAYTIQRSTRHVRDVWGGIQPLGLGDMSQYNAETPGLLEGSLRHPTGSHEHGNDADLAYYQTGANNLGRAVCENDGFFCTEPPNVLDAEPTALLIATLLEATDVTHVVVDPMIREAILGSVDHLNNTQKTSLQTGLVASNDMPGRYVFMHVAFEEQSSLPVEN